MAIVDNIIAMPQSGSIYSGGILTPKYAKIDRATSGDGAAVVNLVASKKIRVIKLSFVCGGAVNVKWQSAAQNAAGGTVTDLGGLMTFISSTGIAEPECWQGIFETAAGEALKLNLSAAVQVGGYLTYIEV